MTSTPHILDRATVEHEVRYAQAVWSQLVATVPDSLAQEVIADFTLWAGRTRPLSSHESAIVTLFEPKTAALFADRVWMQWPGEEPPLDFAFGWESPISLRLAALLAFHYRLADKEERAAWERVTTLSPEVAHWAVTTERDLAADYVSRTGATVAPLFASVRNRDTQYRPGELPVIVTVVDNLNIVAEKSLTWPQVIDFRRDAAARTAYRRFVHWLDIDMVGRPAQFIVDEVSARLERYDWAIRKHGLQTVVGAIESSLNANTLLGASATAVTIQEISQQPWFSLLGSAGLLLGKIALTAAVKLIERVDIRTEHRDIASVHEARTQLRK